MAEKTFVVWLTPNNDTNIYKQRTIYMTLTLSIVIGITVSRQSIFNDLQLNFVVNFFMPVHCLWNHLNDNNI